MKKLPPARKRKGTQTPRTSSVPAPAASGWPRWVVPAVLLLVAAGGTWALFEYVLWARLPSVLVGKWVVVGGPQDGATFDFYRNGTMVGRINVGGREGIINATVRVDGDKMFTTTRNPHNGQYETRVQIIKTLGQRDLVLEDDRGDVLALERAR